MTDDQLLRYSRHILLNEIGIEGQERLLASHVLVVGAGGLGSPALLYLASAGVGKLTVVDRDRVDATNLQRQIAHTTARVGKFKTASAAEAIRQINPDVQVLAVNASADGFLLDQLVPQVDLVLDCTDNFVTRHAINRACVRHGKPLVSGAAIRFDGQIAVYDLRSHSGPCYACVFPEADQLDEVGCATMGVFAPLVGIIGSMQAAEALKLLCAAGTTLESRLLMLDGLAMEWTPMKLLRNPECAVCGFRQPDARLAQPRNASH